MTSKGNQEQWSCFRLFNAKWVMIQEKMKEEKLPLGFGRYR